MPNQATARALESEIVGRLAKFFPEATPVRIPIKLSRSNRQPNGREGGDRSPCAADAIGQETGNIFLEDTVIEYGTPHEVLFVIDRPLEFADRVLIQSKDGTLRAEGSVVAVQYHSERTVVAVRFLKHVPNWIVKS